jgi:hypothetical protein
LGGFGRGAGGSGPLINRSHGSSRVDRINFGGAPPGVENMTASVADRARARHAVKARWERGRSTRHQAVGGRITKTLEKLPHKE